MTAVEWVLKKIGYITLSGEVITYHKNATETFENAKKMEQNQIIRAVNYSIMKLDEMRAEAIKQNITIGELYIKMNKDEKN